MADKIKLLMRLQKIGSGECLSPVVFLCAHMQPPPQRCLAQQLWQLFVSINGVFRVCRLSTEKLSPEPTFKLRSFTAQGHVKTLFLESMTARVFPDPQKLQIFFCWSRLLKILSKNRILRRPASPFSRKAVSATFSIS